MRKKIFVFIFIIPLLGWAQERINKTLPKMSAPISILSKAKGYYYNNYDGQWIEYDRSIANYDDFQKYEFRTITYNEREVLVLLKYNETGYFKYKTISKGFTPYTNINYYILDKEIYKEKVAKCDSSCLIVFDVLKKSDLAQIDTYIKDIEIKSSYYFDNKPDNTDMDEVYARYLKEKKPNYKLYIQFKYYPSKKLIRFFIYEEKCENNRCELGGFTSHNIANKYFSKLKTDEIYNLYYYETNSSLFFDFINLKLSKNQSEIKRKK